MSMVGDVFVSRPDPDSAFKPAADTLGGSDISFCDLETVIGDPEAGPASEHAEFPRSDEETFQAYIRAGFNVMTQANNPNTYQGPEALVKSVAAVEVAGVVHGGAGRDLNEARRPAVIERKGTRVGFVCRTSVGLSEMAATPDRPGVAFYPAHTMYGASPDEHQNPYNYPGSRPVIYTRAAQGEHRAALESDIGAARRTADLVVVSWHWGLSAWYSFPGAGPADVEILEYQRELARMAIDFGADIVVGHGPHHPQPIEVYRGKAIFYSLGNFVHDNAAFRSRTRSTLLARCLIRDKQIQRLGFGRGSCTATVRPIFPQPSRPTRSSR
jgi:poly-gamma-glutamate synthesis protein (capsule biosynthesis protein)